MSVRDARPSFFPQSASRVPRERAAGPLLGSEEETALLSQLTIYLEWSLTLRTCLSPAVYELDAQRVGTCRRAHVTGAGRVGQ